MTTRQRKRLETRARLYSLAVNEFRRVGIEKTRIRDIVERAGVVPGTFYFHFPTKNHVLLELGNRYVARVVDALPGTPEDPPALSQLLAELANETLGIERELGDNELLRAAVSSFQRPPADVELETAGLVELLQASIEAELRGQPDPAGLAAGELAVILLTAFFGALLVGPEDPRERSEQLHKTLEFFARAVARPEKSG